MLTDDFFFQEYHSNLLLEKCTIIHEKMYEARLVPIRLVLGWLSSSDQNNVAPVVPGDLQHRLSTYVDHHLSIQRFLEKSSITEYKIFASIMGLIKRDRLIVSDINTLILCISKMLSNNTSDIRNVHVQTKWDSYKNLWRYPKPEEVRNMIVHASAVINRLYATSEMAASIYALVVISKIHPLVDGNGRLSRIISNVLLNLNNDRPIYIPFFEFSHLGRQALLLSKRETETAQRWDPVVNWYGKALVQYSRLSNF